ncbi:unnamed protein product, partial [Linum tenue]
RCTTIGPASADCRYEESSLLLGRLKKKGYEFLFMLDSIKPQEAAEKRKKLNLVKECAYKLLLDDNWGKRKTDGVVDAMLVLENVQMKRVRCFAITSARFYYACYV